MELTNKERTKFRKLVRMLLSDDTDTIRKAQRIIKGSGKYERITPGKYVASVWSEHGINCFDLYKIFVNEYSCDPWYQAQILDGLVAGIVTLFRQIPVDLTPEELEEVKQIRNLYKGHDLESWNLGYQLIITSNWYPRLKPDFVYFEMKGDKTQWTGLGELFPIFDIGWVIDQEKFLKALVTGKGLYKRL